MTPATTYGPLAERGPLWSPKGPDARTLHPDGHCAQRPLRGWQAFVQRYRVPVDTPLQRDAKRAFTQRTYFVHEYRRLLQNHP